MTGFWVSGFRYNQVSGVRFQDLSIADFGLWIESHHNLVVVPP